MKGDNLGSDARGWPGGDQTRHLDRYINHRPTVFWGAGHTRSLTSVEGSATDLLGRFLN